MGSDTNPSMMIILTCIDIHDKIHIENNRYYKKEVPTMIQMITGTENFDKALEKGDMIPASVHHGAATAAACSR